MRRRKPSSKRGRPAKFPQVKQQIRNAILQGRLRPEDQLPSFPQVAAEHGVGSVTAKRAIDELVSEGWLIAKRGVGTFVNTRRSIAPVVLTLPATNNALYYVLTTAELDEFHQQNPGVCILYSAEPATDLVVMDTYGMVVGCVRGRRPCSIDELRKDLGLPEWKLPAVMRRCAEWEGELFGLPVQLDFRLLQINPQVLQRFGLPVPHEHLDWETYVEILARCRKDEDGDGVVECWGSSCYLHSEEWLIPFWQNGGRLDDEEAFFSPPAIEAIDRLWRLIHVDRLLPLEMPIAHGEMFMKQVRRRFDDGKLALRWIGTRELLHRCPFPAQVLLPQMGPLNRQFSDGILIGIRRECAHPDIAMKFLDFCHRRYVQENAEYPFAVTEADRKALRRRPDWQRLLTEAAKAGTDSLHEGVPQRTWEIENEIFQWFRLFQDRKQTMDRIRECWQRFRNVPNPISDSSAPSHMRAGGAIEVL